ncbi:MAG: hypothetical protein UX17_C0078G0001 [Parcubacteria group bacterium GW2011_GWC2_45_7]|nr:MAG: hypothetical protein UX17_C0078G0001 [Parcubacteria group bacterium GW2011_GWC2_45_7]
MFFQELPDRITLMPTCSVDIQPNGVAAKPTIEVLQHLEKSFPVTAFRLNHPGAAQKRSHPTGNIQALLMLAGCRNLQPFAYKRPTAAQSRMQSKSPFVLKDNSFLSPQRFEFFLSSWRVSSRPRPLLEDRHGWLASNDTRTDASSTGPDGLSALSQTAAVYGPPTWGRPIGHGSIRTSEAIPPNDAQSVQQSSASYEGDGLSAFSEPGLLLRPCLPPAPSGLYSSDSGREPLRSSPAAAPPAPKGGWLSLCRSMLLVLSQRGPVIALWIPFLISRGRFSCPQYNISQAKM